MGKGVGMKRCAIGRWSSERPEVRRYGNNVFFKIRRQGAADYALTHTVPGYLVLLVPGATVGKLSLFQ